MDEIDNAILEIVQATILVVTAPVWVPILVGLYIVAIVFQV